MRWMEDGLKASTARGGREHTHEHMHAQDADLVGTKLLVGVVINVLIVIVQIIGGVISGSLGLISDAAHNASDVVSLGLSYGANRLGRRAPSRRHTFGLRRAEVVAAFVNAAALATVAVWVAIEAAQRLVSPIAVEGMTMMVVAGVGLVANAGSALLLRRHTHEDLNVRSAFLHLVADALTSLCVVISGFAVWAFGFDAADALVSIAIAVWMVREAWGIVRASAHILVEGVPEHLDYEEIASAMEAVVGVVSVHALHVWSISSREHALSAHVEVADDRLSDLSATVRELKRMLRERFGIEHATLEMECASSGCAGVVYTVETDDSQRDRSR